MLRRQARPHLRSVCAWLMILGATGPGLAAHATGVYAGHTADVQQPAALAGGQAGPHAATWRKAQEWLQSGQPKTAYELLAPLEDELAGSIEFDLLFGQAALNADRPSVAAFAFERCLAIDPMHGLCRLGA